MRIPGFTADASLRLAGGQYSLAMEGRDRVAGQVVLPQFSMRSFVCAAVVAAVLAGQEELIPVMVEVCSDAA